MRNVTKILPTIIIITSLSFLLTAFQRPSKRPVKSIPQLKVSNIHLNVDSTIEIPTLDTQLQSRKSYKSLELFRLAIGLRESSNNYQAENQYGYIGRYQFGKKALQELNIKVSKTEFKNDTIRQDQAFDALMAINKHRIRKCKHFIGKRINGIKITESGLLAACHLVGPGNVRKYLRSYGSKVKKDANGTSLEEYIKKFNGFDTSSIIAKRKVKF